MNIGGLLEYNIILNNYAPIGNIYASKVSNFKLYLDSSEVSESFRVKLGGKKHLIFQIIDSYNNILTDQKNLKITIKVEDQANHQYVYLENNEGWVINGEVHQTKFTIVSSKMMDKINLRVELSHFLVGHRKIVIKIDPCDIGEVYLENRCKRCPENSYSIFENIFSKDLSECYECPINAICLGGNQVIPNHLVV
jgi:hypothetical protein